VKSSDPSRDDAVANRSAPATLTAILRRLQSRQPHLKAIIGLLTLVFSLTAWLAYEAASTSREAQQSAEDTLENYALLAADAVVDQSQHLAFETWRRLFRWAAEAEEAGFAPDRVLAQVEYDAVCGCDPALVQERFWIDFERDELHLENGAAPEHVVRRAVEGPLVSFSDAWQIGSALLPTGQLQVFGVYHSPDGSRLRAYGFIAEREVLSPYFAWAGGDRELLPHRHLRDRNLEFLRISVMTPDGEVIHAHGADPAESLSGVSGTTSVLPPLRVRVDIDRAAADLLLFGGMPTSRLPFLLALLTLTAALLLAALVLLRRETELTRLRGEFVASVSHELRTPLAQIRMFAETLMLGRTRSDGERRKALEIIDQEARRLSTLVENVLLFARSERRKVTLVREPVPLGVEIDQAIDTFLPYCRSRNVRVRGELENGVVAPVDRYALRQILINLMDNALKYGPTGQEITVGLAIFGDAARVWVDDEGPGIPASSRERIFDPFYRVDRATERAVAGSGIGLAVVRELTELHGGRAWAEDAPGGGTRVAVQFPSAVLLPAAVTAGAVA
jgi:signal transduction histidine kinase